MSTYYYFHCDKHQVSGGCWTRQAWGWGNADLIEAFKFVMYHVRECGPESIGMHSEHEDHGYASTQIDDDVRREFLQATADIWPRTDDWAFVQSGRTTDQWVEDRLGLMDPNCDHNGYGTKEYPGGVFCSRCEQKVEPVPNPT